jgi:hypothetical protein
VKTLDIHCHGLIRVIPIIRGETATQARLDLFPTRVIRANPWPKIS